MGRVRGGAGRETVHLGEASADEARTGGSLSGRIPHRPLLFHSVVFIAFFIPLLSPFILCFVSYLAAPGGRGAAFRRAWIGAVRGEARRGEAGETGGGRELSLTFIRVANRRAEPLRAERIARLVRTWGSGSARLGPYLGPGLCGPIGSHVLEATLSRSSLSRRGVSGGPYLTLPKSRYAWALSTN